MKEQEVRQIIRNKIRFRKTNNNSLYDGLDMSGYNNSHYSNLEILARFQDLMNLNCEDENRKGIMHLPIFWKGSGKIIRTDTEGNCEVIADVTSQTTEDIIFSILSLQNPNLIK